MQDRSHQGDMTIRMATHAEQQRILALSGKVIVESTMGYVQQENQEKALLGLQPAIDMGAYHLVAIKDNQVVGWILIGWTIDHLLDETVGFIFDLYVFKKYRSEGIGHQLMQAAFKELKRQGFRQCQLNVYAGNRAKRLYEELGFREVSTIMKRPL